MKASRSSASVCGPKGVADLGPVDRDPGDRLGALVEDVLVVGGRAATRSARRARRSAGRPCAGSARARNNATRVRNFRRCTSTTGSPSAPQTCPDRSALVADGIELTYAELEREATAAARRLAARGARRGATVALELPAGLDYVVLLHALMKLGAVAYPVNTRLAAGRARRRARARRAGAGTVSGTARPRADRGRPAAARRARPRRAALPDPHQRHLRRRRGRSGSPTATTSGARSARPSTSASSRPTAGSAACRCSTSAGSRS